MDRFLVYSFDSSDWKAILKSPKAVEAALAAAKPKPSAREMKLAMPWIKKIMDGVKAVDLNFDEGRPAPAPYGPADREESDDEVFSDPLQFFNALRWLCDRLMTPQPTTPIFYSRSFTSFEVYGYAEILGRFRCPFPLPKVDDPSKVAGYVPNAKLKNLKLQPLSTDRLAQIMAYFGWVDKTERIISKKSLAAKDKKGKSKQKTQSKVAAQEGTPGVHERMLEKLGKWGHPIPQQDEIEIAQADFYEVAATVYESGRDLFGIMANA